MQDQIWLFHIIPISLCNKIFDYKEYVECLSKLYDVTLLKSMSIEARNKYLNKFQMNDMIERYNEFWVF